MSKGMVTSSCVVCLDSDTQVSSQGEVKGRAWWEMGLERWARASPQRAVGKSP